jgi:methyl-accepting chemotaxis protein
MSPSASYDPGSEIDDEILESIEANPDMDSVSEEVAAGIEEVAAGTEEVAPGTEEVAAVTESVGLVGEDIYEKLIRILENAEVPSTGELVAKTLGR